MRVDEKSAEVEKRALQTQNKKTGLGGLKERVLVFKWYKWSCYDDINFQK